MKPVTDPNLIAMLEEKKNKHTPVTDPAILRQLNGEPEKSTWESVKETLSKAAPYARTISPLAWAYNDIKTGPSLKEAFSQAPSALNAWLESAGLYTDVHRYKEAKEVETFQPKSALEKAGHKATFALPGTPKQFIKQTAQAHPELVHAGDDVLRLSKAKTPKALPPKPEVAALPMPEASSLTKYTAGEHPGVFIDTIVTKKRSSAYKYLRSLPADQRIDVLEQLNYKTLPVVPRSTGKILNAPKQEVVLAPQVEYKMLLDKPKHAWTAYDKIRFRELDESLAKPIQKGIGDIKGRPDRGREMLKAIDEGHAQGMGAKEIDEQLVALERLRQSQHGKNLLKEELDGVASSLKMRRVAAEVNPETPTGIILNNIVKKKPATPVSKVINNKKFADISPGHAKLEQHLDKLVKTDTFFEEHRAIIHDIFRDTNVDVSQFLEKVSIRPSGRLHRLGMAYYGKKDIAIKKGVALLQKESGGGFYSKLSAEPTVVFLHEYAHLAYANILSATDRTAIKMTFRRIPKKQLREWFSAAEGGDDVAIHGAKYYAKNEREFFAEDFARYIITRHAKAKEFLPLYKRLFDKFKASLEKIYNRGMIKQQMVPLYEKILGKKLPAKPPEWPPAELINNVLKNESGQIAVPFRNIINAQQKFKQSPDHMNQVMRWISDPQFWADMRPQFKPAFDALRQGTDKTIKLADEVLEKMAPYFKLRKADQRAVNKVLHALDKGEVADLARLTPKQKAGWEAYRQGLDDLAEEVKTSLIERYTEPFWKKYHKAGLGSPEALEAEATIKQITADIKQAFSIENYAPRKWNGKWVMHAIEKETGKPIHTVAAKTSMGVKAKANKEFARYDGIRYEITTAKKRVSSQNADFDFSRTEGLINKSGLLDDTAKAELLDELKQVSAKAKAKGQSPFLRRGGSRGYTEDLAEPTFDTVMQLSGTVHQQKAYSKAIKAIYDNIDPTSPLGREALDLVDYLRAHPYEMDAARGFLFHYHLGFRVWSALINRTQNFTIGVPVMREFGITNSYRKLGRAVNDLRKKNISSIERSALHTARRTLEGGLTQDIAPRTIQRGVGKASGKMFQGAELLNRRELFLAAFRDKYAQTANFDEAVKFGEFINDRGNFLYGRLNRSKAFRGEKAVLGTFRTFQIQQTETLIRQGVKMVNGDKNAAKAFATSIYSLALAAGAGGFGIKGMADTAMYLKKKYKIKDTDLRGEAINRIADVTQYGVLGILGIDISGNVGLDVSRMNPSDPFQLFGVAAADIKKTKRAIDEFRRGNYLETSKQAAPAAMRDWLTAYQAATFGAFQSSRGTPIAKVTPARVVLEAVGGQSTGVSEGYERQGAYSELGKRKRLLLDQYANGKMSESDRIKHNNEAIKTMQRWPTKERNKYLISKATLARSRKARGRTAKKRRQGIKNLP